MNTSGPLITPLFPICQLETAPMVINNGEILDLLHGNFVRFGRLNSKFHVRISV